MGMAAILFSEAEPFEKSVKSLQQKARCEIWWKLVKRFQRRRRKEEDVKKIQGFIPVYSTGARAGNPPRGQNFDPN